MKITIITVNYNNHDGLLNTITSINSQIFDNRIKVEFIIVDGNSTDNSAELICNASINNQIDYKYIIESDRGISHAFNKGIKRSSGDYIIMINSGDTLCGSNVINYFFREAKRVGGDLIVGAVLTSEGKALGGCKTKALKADCVPHQGAFVSRNAYKVCGNYSEKFKIRMDYDFFSRFARSKLSWSFCDFNVAKFELGGVSNLLVNRKKFYYEALLVDLRDKNSTFFSNMLRFSYHCLK